MPLPPSLTVKTLHGRYSALPSGSAPTGTVDFVAPAVLRVAADDTIVLPTVYTATVTGGEFSIGLPASDDPEISPTSWTYEVVERLTGHPIRRYRIAVPIATVGTLELADIAPATTVVPSASYATTADIVALDARVDALETGGEGGGGVTDHGALTGLADDDHAQYYNQARGDARYVRPAQLATVATTGVYTDLTGRPSIPDSPDDVGAAPVAHTHIAASVTDLSTAVDARIALVAAPKPVYPLSEYGFHSASDELGLFRDSAAMQEAWFTRLLVPAGKTIAAVGAIVKVGGTVGAGGLNGFSLWTDDGQTQLWTSPNDDTMWTTPGWVVKTLAEPVAAQANDRFIWVGMSSRGYSTPPVLPYVTGPAALTDGGGNGVNRRRAFYSGATSWPTTFDPATYGSSSGGYNPLLLLG